MALQAQGADVFEIAFAAAFHYWNNMIGVPKGLSGACAQPPIEKGFQLRRAAQTFQLPLCLQTIDAANGADAAIALQYFFANVPRVTAQSPLFDAPSRTKRHPALGDFQIAPAAQILSIRSLREGSLVDPAALHGSLHTHVGFFQKIAKREQDRAGMHPS